MTGSASPGGPFTVLIVCTANQCRSPIAEALLRDRLRRAGADWVVVSAGTRAADGEPMDPTAATILRKRGFETSGWRSRQLDAGLIERAHLVLTAETAHRAVVVTRAPAALGHTFPLLQFASLAAHVPPLGDPGAPDAGPRLLAGVNAVRSHVQPGLPGSQDIADPVGRRERWFRACADTITTAVDQLVAPLRDPA